MNGTPFDPAYVRATVPQYDPLQWADPRNANPRDAFVRWATANLNMREVSDAQLAAHWRAFRAGWSANHNE